MPDDSAHWRDSARTPRFYIMDAYACFPFLFFTLHARLWTFELAIASTIFFVTLERFGFTVPVFLRWLRVFIGGKQRPARAWWTERRKN